MFFDFPLYYISFNRKKEVEDHYKKYGFTNINWFPAIDARKDSPYELRENGIISIRGFNDLILGRREHSGLSSLGTVGCTKSHASLWQKCVDDNLPFIIIAEDDGRFVNPTITQEDIDRISTILSMKNSIFVSPIHNIKRGKVVEFIGLHFYIISRDACIELLKTVFPIDVQTDWYISHLATLGKVNVEGYQISKQLEHKSSIQDTCKVCDIPNIKNIYYYKFPISYFVGVLILIVIFLIILLIKVKYFVK